MKGIIQVHYKSYNDLIVDTQRLIRKLRGPYKLVLYIPRSGAIPATIIAQHFGAVLFSIDEFLKGAPMATYSHREQLRKDGRILVVDDSVHAGRRINRAKKQIAETAFCDQQYEFAAVYVGGSRGCVDYWEEFVKQPRMFEWNLYGHSYLKDCGSDIDGVVCVDPKYSDAQNQQWYEEWLPNAEPLHLFTAKVGFLVTSRLERYRAETEAWLAKHNIRYGKLYMSQYLTPQQRRAAGKHAFHKAEIVNQFPKTRMFIESEPKQAVRIREITGKAVYCVKNNRMLK